MGANAPLTDMYCLFSTRLYGLTGSLLVKETRLSRNMNL